jgi:hypothetical protein
LRLGIDSLFPADCKGYATITKMESFSVDRSSVGLFWPKGPMLAGRNKGDVRDLSGSVVSIIFL